VNIPIGIAYSGLKSAIETLKGLNTIITDGKIAAAKSEVTGQFISVQLAMLEAVEKMQADAQIIGMLKTEIVQLKDWNAEAENYETADTGQGGIAYRPKASVSGSEKSHWLCPTCFHNRKASFLQPETLAVGRVEILRCHPCGQEIITCGSRQPTTGRR
jgi:hypothetical protein